MTNRAYVKRSKSHLAKFVAARVGGLVPSRPGTLSDWLAPYLTVANGAGHCLCSLGTHLAHPS